MAVAMPIRVDAVETVTTTATNIVRVRSGALSFRIRRSRHYRYR